MSAKKFLELLASEGTLKLDAGYLRLARREPIKGRAKYFTLDTKKESEHDYMWANIIEQWQNETKRTAGYIFEILYVSRNDSERDDITIKNCPDGREAVDPKAKPLEGSESTSLA